MNHFQYVINLAKESHKVMGTLSLDSFPIDMKNMASELFLTKINYLEGDPFKNFGYVKPLRPCMLNSLTQEGAEKENPLVEIGIPSDVSKKVERYLIAQRVGFCIIRLGLLNPEKWNEQFEGESRGKEIPFSRAGGKIVSSFSMSLLMPLEFFTQSCDRHTFKENGNFFVDFEKVADDFGVTEIIAKKYAKINDII